MKYPYTSISRWDAYENGSRVYAVWRYIASDNMSIKGFITKTRRGTWQLDLSTRYYGNRITETERLSEAKQMAKELLA